MQRSCRIESLQKSRMNVEQMHPIWKAWLSHALSSNQWKCLLENIERIEKQGTVVYPAEDQRLRVFSLNPKEIQVVILGIEPYHQTNTSDGLAFSVLPLGKITPALKCIDHALAYDVQAPLNGNFDLSRWSAQGVFLLNRALTVAGGMPRSHAQLGHEWFTDAVISALSKNCHSLTFMLWGSSSIQKRALIDQRHCILESTYPSSETWKVFAESRPFSRANAQLLRIGKKSIIW